MSFEVVLEKFSGPLHLLLGLIEREELPITEISLAKVTDDYVTYVRAESIPPDELADFLVIATKLLWIKSKALLPDILVEEEETGNLMHQLKLYQIFVEAAEKVGDIYGSAEHMFVAPKFVFPVPERHFSPPPGLTTQDMFDSFQLLLKRLRPFFFLRETSMERVVSVQEKMRLVEEAIASRTRLTFHEIVGDLTSRGEIVVSFLALLELMRQRTIVVTQPSLFDEIVVSQVQ